MGKPIFGRDREHGIFLKAFRSKRAEFIAVYGRRRVGKTFLIHESCSQQKGAYYFYVTGIRNGSQKEQLKIFTESLSQTFYQQAPLKPPTSWLDAFSLLQEAINRLPKQAKVILFFDEFPWMVTARSRLLNTLEYQWNHDWAHDSRIKLIICGSASSWILKHIVNNTGGLYNRVTQRIALAPFTLSETQVYLQAMQHQFTTKQRLLLYMIFGGIPFYLSLLRTDLSAEQNIDALLFSARSPLFDEYRLLLSALFDDTSEYDYLLRQIAMHRYGLSQAELMKKRKVSRGGRAANRLKDLESLGFIQSFVPVGRKEKGVFYRVVDEYLLFYFSWIEPNKKYLRTEQPVWQHLSRTPAWQAWSGYAFEALCYKHIPEIARALNITGLYDASAWRASGSIDQDGVQIDLLFDRMDESITLCEIKYGDKPYVITKALAEDFRRKIERFRIASKTAKQIFFVMICANGLKANRYAADLVDGVVCVKDLF